jgi:hypothetical protein
MSKERIPSIIPVKALNPAVYLATRSMDAFRTEVLAEIETLRGEVQTQTDNFGSQVHVVTQSVSDIQHNVNSMEGAARPLTIPQFSGTHTDDAQVWFDKFEQYAKYRKWTAEEQANAFPVLLDGNAIYWFKKLENKADITIIKNKFLERFYDAESLKWVRLTELSERRQKETETVDDFIAAAEKLCTELDKPLSDNTEVLVRGFLPHIRTFIISKGATTLKEIIQAARMAQGLQPAMTQSSTDITKALQDIKSELQAEIKGMRAQVSAMDVRPTRPAIRQRSPSPAQTDVNYTDTRRVQFRSPSRETPQANTPTQRYAFRPTDPNRRPVYNRTPAFQNRPDNTSYPQRRTPSTYPQRRPPQGYICNRCGKSDTHFNSDCFAKTYTCHSCQKVGHLSNVCQSNPRVYNYP